MRRFILFLFHFLYVTIFISIGGLLLETYFNFFWASDFIQSHLNQLLYNHILILSIGGLFVLLPLLYLLVLLSGSRKESLLKYNTTEGEIIISVFAVEDFIKKVARSFREIKDVYPVISLRGKDGLHISLRIKIWAGVQNLPVTLEELQKEIHNQIQNVLGIEHIYGINVFIAKDSFAQRSVPLRRRSLTKPSIEPAESNTTEYEELEPDYTD